MTEWFYKATTKKLDHVGTMLLAKRGFLCRSAYTKTHARVANVQSVAIGDVLHVYYVGNSKTSALGAFEVVTPEGLSADKWTPPAANFKPIPDCALHEVVDPGFIFAIDSGHAYAPDPKLDKYTGWLLKRVGDAAPAPKELFSQMATLIKKA